MVEIITIGVVSLQGAVSEHITSMNRVFKKEDISGKSIVIRQPRDIDSCDGLILPGGESTTISRLLQSTGMYERISHRITDRTLGIMGTCAGCALLAKELTEKNEEIPLLRAMDMRVERNAFGRQKESFEQLLAIKGFSVPFPAVFIRPPVIRSIGGSCEVLARVGKKIVMARQDNYLALSFHPELTNDLRVHRLFLEIL